MSALSLGMLGFVLSLLGMECTFIGGKDRSKYRKIYTGGWCHIISGKLILVSQLIYRQRLLLKSLVIEPTLLFEIIRTLVGMFLFLQVCCPHLGMLFMRSTSQENISRLPVMD